MKSVLKRIRSFYPVNFVVRTIIRSCFSSTSRIRKYFSIHWPVTGTISFSLPGHERVKLFSKSDDYISTQAFWKGFSGYESGSALVFYHLAKKADTVFDIGANIGFFALTAASANPSANVYAFEPVPKIVERLKKNISLNQAVNTTAEAAAVGNVNGMITFYVPDSNVMPLAGSTKEGWSENKITVNVPSVTLDNYTSTHAAGNHVIIKMDCEFHEAEALEGMKELIAVKKPVLLMEVLFPESEGVIGHYSSDQHLVIQRMMKDAGYHFYMIGQDELVHVNELVHNSAERNYLFSVKRTAKDRIPFADIKQIESLL